MRSQNWGNRAASATDTRPAARLAAADAAEAATPVAPYGRRPRSSGALRMNRAPPATSRDDHAEDQKLVRQLNQSVRRWRG
jgi:hypothetical protein